MEGQSELIGITGSNPKDNLEEANVEGKFVMRSDLTLMVLKTKTGQLQFQHTSRVITGSDLSSNLVGITKMTEESATFLGDTKAMVLIAENEATEIEMTTSLRIKWIMMATSDASFSITLTASQEATQLLIQTNGILTSTRTTTMEGSSED